MTKLGLQQPAIHSGGVDDSAEHKEEKEQIKIDPKVFTVLQPTVIPMPAAPQKPARSHNSILTALLFVFLVLLTAIGLLFVGSAFDVIDIKALNDGEKPQMDALIGGKFDTSSEKASDDVVSIPLARVVVVEDISNNDENQKMMIDSSSSEQHPRPLHPDELEMLRQHRQHQFEMAMLMAQQQRVWRLRRIQAAIYQQLQQQQQQEEMGRQMWIQEQNRRQWEAAMWHQRQMQQMQQPQQFVSRPVAVWQQPPPQFSFPQQQQQQQQQEFQAPIPQPSIHDRIYEQLQRKSQNIPINAPSRQIWTAITPTPAAPAMESPVTTPLPENSADVSDTILRDIFSAFDEQRNTQIVSTQAPIQGQGAVVVEDRFPRVEQRTTTAESAKRDNEEEEEEDEEYEGSDDQQKPSVDHDPFAAVLKFFDNAPTAPKTQPEVKTTEKPSIVF